MGGGGKGGGSAHTPKESPNTLESAQRLKIIDLLCEGVAGHDVSLKNIYLDDTPVQNADGSYNFSGVEISALAGTHDQSYMPNFDTTNKINSVGVEIKHATPITRTITDPLIDRVRVTLALGSLVEMKDNGDRVGSEVSLTVTCGNEAYPVTITGKTTSTYHRDVVLDNLPDVPFNITVTRNTADSTTDKISNATHWATYTEIIDAKFSYPNSVVVGLSIDSAQFGGKVPKRTYLNHWTQIKIPNNYNPETREYDGIWNGEFKTMWSNNPAWVFYDLVTDTRYGLGDRLGEFGCDKWALYQIGKYCDQIVDDGFGGKEPRFTCNAYLSEARDAKALLDDLASVFRGIAVWDGLSVTAFQDAKKDPVATYANSNVVDGVFEYSGAAQKTIFTAVHVKYSDKDDGYATKTEYVADDVAIKRYGLNVKQITAFGCTSRGQAARVGKWLIETSIRERQMISFKVGREGIRHNPFDVIEIADSDYAGDQIAGRVIGVDGTTVTLDRELDNAVGSVLKYYANGVQQSRSIVAVDGAVVTLDSAPTGIEAIGVFSVAKSDVKPRLFRALSIAEDDGTYTISAIFHDENKEAVVDDGVTFERDDTATKHKPVVSYGTVSKDGDTLIVGWEGNNATAYLIKVYRDGKLYQTYTQADAQIRLTGLPNGSYRAEIRAKNSNGKLSDPVIKTWTISYDIQGLIASPELFSIKLDWTNPVYVVNKASIEVWHSKTNDQATATKVANLPYPTTTFTQNGVKLSETHYFWLRIVDEYNNYGEWVAISGSCSTDTSAIVESINGQITETELAQSLIDSLQADVDSAVAAEAQARADAIASESEARTKALNAKAAELGTAITAVEEVNTTQAQQISTLTAADDDLTAAIEGETQARIDGDAAEAQARETLATQVGSNQSSITQLSQTVSDNEQATAEMFDSLSASVGAGGNLLYNSEFAGDFAGWNIEDIKSNPSIRVDVNFNGNNPAIGSKTYASPDDNNLVMIRDDRTSNTVSHNNLIVRSDTVPVTAGAIMQSSCLMGGWSLAGNCVVYIDFRATNGELVARQQSNQENFALLQSDSFYGRQTVTDDLKTTTLDTLKVCWSNYVVPNGAVTAELCLWLRNKVDGTTTHSLIMRPQLSEVDSLSTGYVPYQRGKSIEFDELSAELTEFKQTTVTKDQAQSIYTIKTQAIAGGKKAIAGIAVGAMANETTAESQVIVMADKFGVVKDAGDGTVKPMFAVVDNKVAVNGDLIASGSILGEHIAANQTITAPQVSGGTLTGSAINNGSGTFSVDADGNMVAKSANITGTVNATDGTFRGRIEATDGFFSGTVYADKVEGDLSQEYSGGSFVVPPSARNRTMFLSIKQQTAYADEAAYLNGVKIWVMSNRDAIGSERTIIKRLLANAEHSVVGNKCYLYATII